MSGDRSLAERHRAVVPSWLATYYQEPLELISGDGRTVWDADGNRYLDFFGGILTTIVGHSVPEVVEALQAQAAKLLHTSTLYLSRPMVELAERLAAMSGIPDAKVFLTTSGTEANEAALLAATSYRRSNQVLALRNSYHGRSFGTVAITGNRSWSPTSLSGLQVTFVHGGYRLRSPFRDLDDEAYTKACVQDLRDLLDMCTSGDVACMIAEPVQGVGGFATPPDGFFGAFAEVLREHGILFVSDEVQTGFGRTGEHLWGYEAHGFTPDLLTLAKGIGNGVSLGAVVGRADVLDSVTANSISTFGGNPLSCVASLATLDVLRRDDLQGNALKRGAQLAEGLRAIAAEHEWIAEVRGRGLMLAIEACEPGGIQPCPDAAVQLLEATRANGLLVGKGGLYGNVIRVTPPLSVTEAEVVEALDILRVAASEVRR
ncbi:MAG: Putative aminotransferase [uncultured Acidimicrobiales bacterium]|uniref:alanine--glyoxylate transaminase n=1 Tax=uncultured Acidimicrobiales bacterium TaxID=310071 RepID=A0A6J4I943_9ACTN|nr:MAG: Putative aminotransferase [uncultured Acidimicrobiales bacterium]